MRGERFLAPLGLLVAATTWGLIWYPYRVLEEAGLSGALSSLLTYLVALGIVLAFCRGHVPRGRAPLSLMLAMALAAGWTNLSYVLAVLHGEIMRVMLLFYLAPLWTVLFARVLLKENAGLHGHAVIGFSLAGAWVMLGGFTRLPLPGHWAEWVALSSGIAFALMNVLSRRLREVSTETRAVWIFGGMVAITLVPVFLEGAAPSRLTALDGAAWAVVLATGVALVVATLSVQYGLSRIPANHAVVILLSELVVAALGSWWLAGEVMGWEEWLGGAMIVVAALWSGKLEGDEPHA